MVPWGNRPGTSLPTFCGSYGLSGHQLSPLLRNRYHFELLSQQCADFLWGWRERGHLVIRLPATRGFGDPYALKPLCMLGKRDSYQPVPCPHTGASGEPVVASVLGYL